MMIGDVSRINPIDTTPSKHGKLNKTLINKNKKTPIDMKRNLNGKEKDIYTLKL